MEFYYLFWLIGYVVARFAIDFLSAGHAFIDPSDTPAWHFNWLGYRRNQAGQILVARNAAGVIGMLMIIVFVVLVLDVAALL